MKTYFDTYDENMAHEPKSIGYDNSNVTDAVFEMEVVKDNRKLYDYARKI